MLDIDICGEASNGREAILQAETLRPDVIIMDLSMPLMNGLEAIREIGRFHPETQIVILSQYDVPASLSDASGAITHVPKASLWTKLVPALRSIQFGDEPDASGEATSSLESARKALRESEERFRFTFEQSAVGMSHVSPDGHHLRTNSRLSELLGYTPQEFQSLHFHDITHPSDLAREIDLARKLANGEIDRYCLEARYFSKGGNIVPADLTVNAVRDSRGKLRYSVRVIAESAARISAQAALETAKRDLTLASGHLDLLAHHTGASIHRCSREFKYLWVNQLFADWLRKPVDQIVGRLIADIIGSEAFSLLRPRFEEVLSGKDVTYEETTTYGGVEPRHISAAYRPIVDPAGSITGWLAVLRDLTPPKSRSASS